MLIFRMFFSCFITIFFLFFMSFHVHAGLSEPETETIETVVDSIRPALVRIHAVTTSYRQGREIKFESVGSGAIITKEGHVITNHHVAGRSVRLFCTLSDNSIMEAELTGTDPLSDIAVLRLLPDTKRQFPTVTFGNSDLIKVGDHVLALGNPMALSQSVTLGIVSNTKMVMPRFFKKIKSFKVDGEPVGAIVRWIGHDASIFGGNSGGPLVNLKGKVIGINEIKFGLGGAIPSNLARPVAEELIRNGKVKRSWLGVEVQPMPKHMESPEGILVSGVVDGSPAQKAGLKSGDVLLQFNGKKIHVRHAEELPLFNKMVADLPVGSRVELIVLKDDGKRRTLRAVTIERESRFLLDHELKSWGLTIRNLGKFAARELKFDGASGVLVSSVRPGGPSGEARPPLRRGDVITSVNGKKITDVNSLKRISTALCNDCRDPVTALIGFKRKTESLLTVVKIGNITWEDRGLEVQKAWLPVAYQVVTRDMARQFGRPEMSGVRITQVFPESVAEKAGLKEGDIILALDGEPIEAWEPEDHEVFSSMIRQYKIGSKAEFKVLRQNKEMAVTVKFVRSPRLAREMKRFKDNNFEFTARNLTYLDRVRERWSNVTKGVIVTDVKQGGWAALGHLAVDDLIVAIDGKGVSDVNALAESLKKLKKKRPRFVTFRILRGIHTVFFEMEPKWEE
jgi:serine protease Do